MKKFEDIVETIVELIDEGMLKPGDQLLPHRQMAYEYKCSVGTASRAYAELERRGITYGKVGQGTFIYGTEKDAAKVGKGVFFPEESWTEGNQDLVDLSKNSYFHQETDTHMRHMFQRLAQQDEPNRYLDYFDSRGRAKDRHIAAHWLQGQLGVVDPDKIIITAGVQSGLYLAMATLASPGDVVASEAFGYPGIRAAARELDVRLAPIEMDDEGLRPDVFEQVCKRGNVKILVTVPTNHNPTGTTQPLERRIKLIEIAQRYHVHIVEDAVYAPLQTRDIPSYAMLAPADTVYLTSLSKAFSPGLRVGYMVAPLPLIPRLATKMTAINWMTSPLTLDMTNYLLQNGTAEQQARELMQVCARREAMALRLLGPWLRQRRSVDTSPLAHFWLQLPVSMTMPEFVSAARDKDIVVLGGDSFALNKTVPAQHIRLCVMAEPDEARLKTALKSLCAILQKAEAAVKPPVINSQSPARARMLP